MTDLRIGVLTCSDSCSAGLAEDTSGREIMDLCEQRGWLVVAYHVCPDEMESVCTSLIEMSDVDEVDVVLTVGGTALKPRDVTADSTQAACERLVPGFGESIRSALAPDDASILLSRNTAGIRGKTLVVNLPGGGERSRDAFSLVADHLESASKMTKRPAWPPNPPKTLESPASA